MPVRQPIVAGRFYPADRAGCLRMINVFMPDHLPDDVPDEVVAGVVPHAGWVFSGATAAKVFAAIEDRSSPDTFVLLSAVHSFEGSRAAIYGSGAWETPLGQVKVDEELAQALLGQSDGRMEEAPSAHSGEHSAEVQVPFIQHLFPDALILPVMIPPNREAPDLGKAIGRIASEFSKEVAILGTSDLTHYGPNYGFTPAGTGEEALDWVRSNDRRVINMMLQMEAEQVVPETQEHRNACGGGAIAAVIAAARALGADEGVLLEYTTSHEVMPKGPATSFVGYAGVVFG